MTISAACTVKDGAGSPVVTTDGVDVTPANTITIALASVSGVDDWTLLIFGMDETTAEPTVTVDATTKTATFTAPAAGAAIGFLSKATSRNGRDPATGRGPYSVTETFGVYTLTSGNRVGFTGETFEGSVDFGWAEKVNALIRAGGGGGSTPTGTGFRHITGGTEDGAAALVVNADVDAAAGIVGSKLAANLAITTSLAVGTNPSASGAVRVPTNTWITGRNASNSADLNLIKTNAGDNIELGDTTSANALILGCFAGGNVYVRLGGNDVVVCYAGSIRAVQPITGEDNFYSSPYAVHGSATVAEGDTTRTEVAAIYKFTHIIYTGAMAAGRTVTFPLPGSLAASYHKTIFNNTTGGFAITLANGGGAVVAVAAGKTALLAFEPAGVRRLTADV